MKKKILIVNNNMHIGGVQKSLVNLLHTVSQNYQVTLLLFSRRGALVPDVPEGVRVITVKSPYCFFGLTRNDPMRLSQKLGRAFYAGITRLFGRRWAVRIMSVFQKKLGQYDVAISFLHSGPEKSFYGGCNEFVLRHVDAKKKGTFLHCDFGQTQANTPQNRRLYERFDWIAACSEGCKQAFIQQMPHLADRTWVVENCCDHDGVRRKAKEAPVCFENDKIHVVTVARLGKEKGVDRGVRAIAGLGALREKLQYHIVGDGIEQTKIREEIQRAGLQAVVTMHGSRENPYGFIDAADILFIPSRSEAAPMVIGEAAALGTPILSTKTSSAVGMIETTGFGWVCENREEDMTQLLSRLLSDTSMIDEKKRFLKTAKLSNEHIVLQFAALAEL